MDDEVSDAFDEFVKQNPVRAKEALKQIKQKIIEDKVFIGGHPIPVFLKPGFFSEEEIEEARQRIKIVYSALKKIIEEFYSNKKIRKLFTFNEKEKELVSIHPGYKTLLPIMRFDEFRKEQSKYVEFNTESPGSLAYSSKFQKIFMENQFMKEFFAKHSVHVLNPLDGLQETLLACYQSFGGKKEKPTIVLCDWKNVKTLPDIKLIMDYFKGEGFESFFVEPADFFYENKKLFAKGKEVDIVYNRAIFRELIEKWDSVQPLINAAKDQAICFVNPFSNMIASYKELFGLIFEGKFDYLFTEQEKQVIKESIPWTCNAKKTKIMFRGKEHDLVELLKEKKDLFVLKPSASYGGIGVALGNQTGKKEWNALIDKIVAGTDVWVVQEFVDIPQVSVPVFEPKLHFEKLHYNLNPYVLNGKYLGDMLRVSKSKIINISAGGGLLPLIIAEK